MPCKDITSTESPSRESNCVEATSSFRSKLATVLMLVVIALALILGAAHFMRAGEYGITLSCITLMVLLWTRLSWVRITSSIVCFMLAVRWVWVTGFFIQMRIIMGEPWLRLMCILGAVSLFSLFVSWLLCQKRAICFANKRQETAIMSTCAFLLVFLGYICVDTMSPQVLILERFLPDFGLFQGFICAVWATFVVHHLNNRNESTQFRMRIWRLFSLVFFIQLFLGFLGYSIFLMSESLHLPIPGLIIASPLYRGSGYFMPILFAVSILLVGSAWCSHLCYFGVWDATLANRANIENYSQKRIKKTPPKWLPYMGIIMLILTVFIALVLRFSGVSTLGAVVTGATLGLLFIPATIFISMRYGVAGYCVGICPLGVLATRLRFLQPWRLVFTEKCTFCQKCFTSCQYMALDKNALEQKTPHATCTLCRNCINVCRHNGCEIRFAWWVIQRKAGQKDKSVFYNKIFTVLVATLHSLFIGIAMI